MLRPIHWKSAIARCVAGCALILGSALPAFGASITVSLGNTNPGLTAGTEVSFFDVLAAQSGQAAPFDGGVGSDATTNASFAFTFTYTPATILSAVLEFGIVDADGASPGNQVALFQVAGADLTGAANTAFNGGGASGYYDVFMFDLGGLLINLAGGTATVMLNLTGPVLSPNLFPPPELVEEGFNGANLIFATLRLTTQDGGGGGEVPEPGTLMLLAVGLSAMYIVRRRRSHVPA